MVTYRHIDTEGKEVLNIVKSYGHASARVNVPKKWIGCTVRVTLVEEKQSAPEKPLGDPEA